MTNWRIQTRVQWILYKKAFYKQSEETFVYHGPTKDWLKAQAMV